MTKPSEVFKVEVWPHDPRWREAFAAESRQIALILGENLQAVHHIGSTAIPDIYAKPIIDLLVEVINLAQVDCQNSAFTVLGYQAMGEFGIPGRRYFRKFNELGTRTHHLHLFEVGSDQIRRHLAFRDYLLAHPDVAQQYSDLKQNLARQYPDNIAAYMDGKAGLIQEIDRKAAVWQAVQAEQSNYPDSQPVVWDEHD